MNILEATIFGVNHLKHLENPKLETEMLLSTILKKDRVFLKINPDFLLPKSVVKIFQLYISKRSKNIPMAYILGYKDWNEFRILVSEEVLIPRDETELLCDHIVKNQKKTDNLTLLDIGTGTGCIPIFLSKKLKTKNEKLKIMALDISQKALEVAEVNFKTHGIEGEFIHSDLLTKIPSNSFFDIIAANLPYVPKSSPVSKDLLYEPKSAIFSGTDGLDHICQLASEINVKNVSFGVLWLEFLPRQQKKIAGIFSNYQVDFLTDVGGEVFFAKIHPHD